MMKLYEFWYAGEYLLAMWETIKVFLVLIGVYFLSNIIHELGHSIVAIFLGEKIKEFYLGSGKEERDTFRISIKNTAIRLKRDFILGRAGIITERYIPDCEDISNKHKLLFLRMGAWSNIIISVIAVFILRNKLTIITLIYDYYWLLGYIIISILGFIINLVPISKEKYESDGYKIRMLKRKNKKK